MVPRRASTFFIVLLTLLLLCAFCLTIISCGESGKDGEQVKPDTSSGQYVPGQLIVKFKSGIGPDERDRVIEEAGGESVIEPIGPAEETNTYLIKLNPGSTVEEAIDKFKSRKEIEYAEPNYVSHIQ